VQASDDMFNQCLMFIYQRLASFQWRWWRLEPTCNC